MDTFLLIMRYVSGPLIGAIIGYFTNYLAVKMLFRPYYPKKIGKLTLPFTPGIIPKRQPALARAVGTAVGKNLFTGKDLSEILSAEQTQERIADIVVDRLKNADGSVTIKTVAEKGMSEEQFDHVKDKFGDLLTERILSSVSKMEVGDLIAREGKGFAEKKFGFLGSMIVPYLPMIGEAIENYIVTHGEEKIKPVVVNEMTSISEQPIVSLTQKIDEEELRQVARTVYREVLLPEIDRILASFDIAGIVEQKVNTMSVKELEELCMSVMKKELSAIVNLGALIGLLLGIINIFL